MNEGADGVASQSRLSLETSQKLVFETSQHIVPTNELLIAVVSCLSIELVITLFYSCPTVIYLVIYLPIFRMERPLWNFEEVSSRNWNIESAERMGRFVNSLVTVLDKLPSLSLSLTEVAMSASLCPNLESH